MFPIDPTLYFMGYAFLVFLCPWAIFATYLIREFHYLRKKKVINWFYVNPRRQWSKIREFRERDPKSKYLFGKCKQWMRITLLAWVLGFVFLGICLFILEANDLLINHSKGIYGPNEKR